jgi:hypothetical protein
VLVAGVDAVVEPFAAEGLDEAFGFAVGLRAARPGVAWGEAEVAAAGLPLALEALAVVGQDLFGRDAVIGVEAAAFVQEGERRGGRLRRVEPGVGEPAVVVDADEEVLVAGAASRADQAAADAAAADQAQLFDVDMQQLTRPGTFIADNRLSGTLVEAGAAVAAEDRVHGRGGQAELPADRMGTTAKLAACPQHSLLNLPGSTPG